MLQETIKHLKEVCRKENLDISPNCLFENAIKIVISNNINTQKKENIKTMSNYQKDKKVSQNVYNQATNDNKPTNKQIIALKRLGKFKEGMTKKDCWKIINESKKELK
jgi:hypothetical protein